MKKLLCAILVFASAIAHATTYNISAGSSTATIQSTINTAGTGSNNTVSFAAGTYSITSSISVPCGTNLTLTGPVATTPTAILSATFTNTTIFNANNCNGLNIYYLNFANSGGIGFGNNNNSNIDIEHNSFTHLPSIVGGGDPSYESGVFFNGNINSTIQNVTIKYNLFGSSDSCTAVFNDLGNDDGGFCGGVFIRPGFLTNYTNQFNEYYHVEQAHKIVELGCCTPGQPLSVMNNVSIRYNYIHNHHRIGIETQAQLVGTQDFYVSDNIITDPINPGFYTMMISDACCQFGRNYQTSTGLPSHMNDNVLYSTIPLKNGNFYAPAIGQEYWAANNSTADNNVIGSLILTGGVSWSNMITWGYEGSGSQTWYIRNNYICAAKNGTYITNEEGQTNSPIISGNTTPATCTQQTAAAATISPAGGATTFPKTITLSSTGTNHSIWYTIDGSTPVPGSGTAKRVDNGGTFVLNTAATVKAVGMWGVPPQPAVHAATLGYGPSAVTSQTYTGGGGGPTLSSITVTTTGGGTSFNQGTTNQLTATGNYSDGSTQNLSSTATWLSSNTTIGTVSSTGLFTAGTTAGTTNITATFGSVTSPALTLTVNSAGTNPTVISCNVGQVSNINTIPVGQTIQFNTTATYSDTVVRSIPDAFGNVNAYYMVQGTGTGTITATGGLYTASTAGTTHVHNTVSGKGCTSWDVTNTAMVTLTSIAVTSANGIYTLSTGSTLRLKAIGTYSDFSTADITSTISSWTANNSSVATVDSTGLITAVAVGTGTFKATQGSVTSPNSPTFTVSSSVMLTSITISTPNNLNVMFTGWTIPWKAMGTYSDNSTVDITGTVTWVSSNLSAATFNANILKNIAPGSGTVSATLSGITSNIINMTYSGTQPLIFTLTGIKLTFTGTSITISYK